LMSVLRKSFRPEFLNRIDEIIVFHSLTKEQIKEITKLQLERLRRTARGQGIELSFEDSLIEHLTEIGYVPEFGARELRRKIQTEVETVLARAMLKQELKEGDEATLSYSAEKGVSFEKAPQKKPVQANVKGTKDQKEKKTGTGM
jgi:ATP-dependent Clp protease ATP-binding subunit ClpC